RPVLDQPPPPPPQTRDSIDAKIDGVTGGLPDFQFESNITGTFNPDRDAQPLVRIPPQYPDRCRSSKVEYVLVEFDVTPEGSVVNPRVVESSNRCFDRSSTRAVQRWKYAPKIVDGEPRPRQNVVTQFTYQPAED
ncbi:MAG: energy transducer TonB, partial [Pseudomonadota bacterium]